MKKESAIKEFIKATYSKQSPIPYILSIQIFLFVIIHLADLLVDTGVLKFPLYDWFITNLSLPQLPNYISKPWTLFTYPFVYTGLFSLLFDCLWLYWLGNLFLNLLSSRQLLTVYFAGMLISGLVYLGLSEIPFLAKSPQTYLFTSAFGLGSLVGSLMLLVPKSEIRLFLFGNVKFQVIGIVYIIINIGFYVMINKVAAVTYLFAVIWGFIFMHQLKHGNDLSRWFKSKSKSRLRVVHTVQKTLTYKSLNADLPNQDVIDEILDKISQTGYESLSSLEKEILFKASRED